VDTSHRLGLACGTVSRTSQDTITYQAGVGESNDLAVSFDPGGQTAVDDAYIFTDLGVLDIQEGAGCTPNDRVDRLVGCEIRRLAR